MGRGAGRPEGTGSLLAGLGRRRGAGSTQVARSWGEGVAGDPCSARGEGCLVEGTEPCRVLGTAGVCPRAKVFSS